MITQGNYRNISTSRYSNKKIDFLFGPGIFAYMNASDDHRHSSLAVLRGDERKAAWSAKWLQILFQRL